MPLIKASRRWRRGMRTVIVAEKELDMASQPVRFQEQAQLYRETWSSWQDTSQSALVQGPRAGDVRAAIAPFLANATVGVDSYKWILYGDDDTVWFRDNVLRLLGGLDPAMPYFLSDALWFPQGGHGVKLHPNREAPRCLPCNYSDPLLDTGGCPGHSGFVAPKGCPCTHDMLAATDAAGVFDKATGRFKAVPGDPNYPDAGWWYMIHGGAGAIISSGLMRLVPWDTVVNYVSKMEPQSGDAMLTRIMWNLFTIAPTDPGYGFCRAHIQMFDPGWQGARARGPEDVGTGDRGNDPTGVLARLEAALGNTGGCDSLCEDQLKHMITSHVRSRFASGDVYSATAQRSIQAVEQGASSYRPAAYLIHRLVSLFEQYSHSQIHQADKGAG